MNREIIFEVCDEDPRGIDKIGITYHLPEEHDDYWHWVTLEDAQDNRGAFTEGMGVVFTVAFDHMMGQLIKYAKAGEFHRCVIAEIGHDEGFSFTWFARDERVK